MRQIITPANKTNIYWPQSKQESFILRYCIIQDGKIKPVYEEYESYEQASKALIKARIKQGFRYE